MKTVEEILSNGAIFSKGRTLNYDGISGYLSIERIDMSFIASWGGGWDHVSVAPLNRKKVPTWEQMCKVKDIFFKPDESVIQVHPPKEEYVNNMSNCLHLWRCSYKEMLLPPSCFVGIKPGQTREELIQEIKEAYEKAGEAYVDN